MRDDLIKFIKEEVSFEEREVRKGHASDVSYRVRSGKCITDLKFKGEDEDGLFIYSFVENQSKFRAGDLLVVNKGKVKGDRVLAGGALVWLHEIDHVARLIKLELLQQIEPPRSNNCTADVGFYDYNSERLKHSAELAYDDDELAAFIEGRADLAACDDLDTETIDQYCREYPNLTRCQAQAFACAMNNRATFIQGPPGSGKTFLLAQIIRRAMALGQSVLISANTHKAIDNLLLATVKSLPSAMPIVKILGKGKVASLHPRILQTSTADPQLLELRGPYLIGATVHQAYKFLQNSNVSFDLVVIDEASQMTLAQSLPPLLNASRYVIAGDHRQLPPIFSSTFHPEFLTKSLFEYMFNCYEMSTITLDVTFRMSSTINEFPSRAFYSSLLRSSKCAAERRFTVVSADEDELNHLVCGGGAITFIELDHHDAALQAREEADLVARLVCSLLTYQNVRPEELAVVSPHRAHNEAIRAMLLRYASIDSNLLALAKAVLIDTVDRLQGQEREVIVFSLCASSRPYTIDRASFLYSPNRLNVAITRSRTKLFVVGSKYFFPHINGIIVDPRLLKLWQDYYEYLVSQDHCIVSPG